jgi:type II secretory pathway predicted ATPase ExeA
MPFLDHFGLADYPFKLTPDLDLYYPDDHAQALLGALMFAVLRGDGLLKVVGEVGSGKTLLARKLAERMKGQKVAMATLSPSGVWDQEKLTLEVARAFGAVKTDAIKGNPADKLAAFLKKSFAGGKRNVLVIDEAQVLGIGGLETVRLLSNLETEKDKLLQIILFGQPELDHLLQKHELRQVAQRINFSFTTHRLTTQAVADYVRFRLDRLTKPEGRRVLFTSAALRKLATASNGLPRIVHLLADKALMAAFAEGAPNVEASHVRRAIKETPDLALRRRLAVWIERLRAA